MQQPPLSLYMHLPWCVRKCPYCDFNSHSAGKDTPKSRYVSAMLVDLVHEAANADGRELQSIFLGGGTPSLFSPDEIAELLNGVKAHFTLAEDIEITMEANPGTVEFAAPAGYRDAGVTRLSVGAQSFDDGMLEKLGRIHTSADIVRAISAARDGGFDDINIDVMYALPGQTPAMALADLEAAVELAPTHISWYQLTLEPNTVFYARPPANLPDDDLCYEIQERGRVLLHDSGYEQYEISAYARGRSRCRHNLNYWQFGDYLAVGAGAHGKLTRANGIQRYQKPAHPVQYMNTMELAAATARDRRNSEFSLLSPTDLIFEFMLNTLRLEQGFSEQLFVERTGLAVSDLLRATDAARQKGLLTRNNAGTWRPSDLGRRFLNDLQSEFISDAR